MTDSTEPNESEDTYFLGLSAEFDGEQAPELESAELEPARSPDGESADVPALFEAIGDAVRTPPPTEQSVRDSHISAALGALETNDTISNKVASLSGARNNRAKFSSRARALPAIAAAAAVLIIGGVVITNSPTDSPESAALNSAAADSDTSDSDASDSDNSAKTQGGGLATPESDSAGDEMNQSPQREEGTDSAATEEQFNADLEVTTTVPAPSASPPLASTSRPQSLIGSTHGEMGGIR